MTEAIDVSHRTCPICYRDTNIEPVRGRVLQCPYWWCSALMIPKYQHGERQMFRYVPVTPESVRTNYVAPLTTRIRVSLLCAVLKLFFVLGLRTTLTFLIGRFDRLSKWRFYRVLRGGHWERFALRRVTEDGQFVEGGFVWQRVSYCSKKLNPRTVCEGSPAPLYPELPPIDAEFAPPCHCGPQDVPCRADCDICQSGECPKETR